MTAPRLDVDPWQVREPAVDLDCLPVTETLFSLSNGHLGIRGTLDEVEPHAVRGTFLAGVHERHPLSYPEDSYGHPEYGQAMIAVADATPLRLLVDGIPLDVRTVDPEVHERRLDLRTGILERRLVWRTPRGNRMELRSQRLVSLRERSLSVVRYRVRSLDGPAHVVVRSELVLGQTPPEVENGDPRVADALGQPFEILALACDDTGGALTARTRGSAIRVATAAQHLVVGHSAVSTESVSDRHVVTTVTADLDADGVLEIEKHAGHIWAHEAEAGSLQETARAVVDSGISRGFDHLAAEQREVLDELWERADVEIDGDDELQQALRFSVFTLFTSTACIDDAPLGGKGLTGLGYSGHTFWDVEGFVVPVLSLLLPDAAARLLRWRASTLDAARERADVLGLKGATFAWRTIDGREASAYWPASTAAMHVNASISRAFWLHGNVTGEGPAALGGLEVLVETARLWMSMGHDDADGGWHLFGMTGPDEYTGVVDDNVFTNLMARRNLLRAADACEQLPEQASALGVAAEESARWRAVAEAVHIPFDEHLGVHPANTGFTTYREWRFEDKQDSYPVQEHQHYAKIYRRQVIKQADLVQALWWCRDDFTDQEQARDLDYYEARTVRDSSLSASTQAVVCARAQHPDLAHRYLRESALADLRDLRGDADAGLHLASVGGTWLALTAGLGGLREDREQLELAPLLPSRLTRLRFRMSWRGRLLQVETTRAGTTLTLLRGQGPLPVVVDGAPVQVGSQQPVTVPLRAATPLLPEPTQPVGRAPLA
ncbi:glycoside hydrolase family 65 protein [Brachybacterium sp. UNK5269]|uniref:glycoside hydrolase family 65 protein n=1 Tax=Brachybacterium sp. UNK5269 TaxID=3408576 RepID=UPI003BAFCD0C